MRNREDGKDCNACYMSNCSCECKTCTDVRERNRKLSPNELIQLNLEDAVTKATIEGN